MGGGGGGDQTTTTKMEPWGPTKAPLSATIGSAKKYFDSGAFGYAPGFGPTTQLAMGRMREQAKAGSPLVDQGAAGLGSMMGAGQSFLGLDPSEYSVNGSALSAAKNAALGDAIPAALAPFSANGMTDSSVARQEVGRAAMNAIAPYEYDAMNRMADRRIGLAELGGDLVTRGATLAPQLQGASFMDEERLLGLGQSWDQQRAISATDDLRNLTGYRDYLLGAANVGGMQSGTQPGASGFGRAAGGALSGVAAGAATGNPWLMAGGGLLGLMSAF